MFEWQRDAYLFIRAVRSQGWNQSNHKAGFVHNSEHKARNIMTKQIYRNLGL